MNQMLINAGRPGHIVMVTRVNVPYPFLFLIFPGRPAVGWWGPPVALPSGNSLILFLCGDLRFAGMGGRYVV